VRALLAGDRPVMAAFSKLRTVYGKWAWLAGWPVTGSRRGEGGAFSTLLRRPGLRASNGGVLVT